MTSRTASGNCLIYRIRTHNINIWLAKTKASKAWAKRRNYEKNHLRFCCVCAVALLTGSCSKNEPERFTAKEIERYNFKKIKLKKINDYLFEVTNSEFYTRYYYNPYTFEDGFMGVKEWHGACSGIPSATTSFKISANLN